jgi:acylphosphatase
MATGANSQHPWTLARLFCPYNVLFMRVARRCLISGRVQGVGFRYFVEGLATAEGIHGWVRNLADGRVEAWLEGERASVERVEAALWRGPSGADVERVDAEEAAPSGRATGFSIR